MAAAILLLRRRRRRRRHSRSCLVNCGDIKLRLYQEQGAYGKLVREFRLPDHESFRALFRMDVLMYELMSEHVSYKLGLSSHKDTNASSIAVVHVLVSAIFTGVYGQSHAPLIGCHFTDREQLTSIA
ncbi:hypothetical protein LSAT2_000426 [Lamellibrachia satsuma]|nr:hypothetical protein LSAT2_000426 [Lamellibrachia satsuma]